MPKEGSSRERIERVFADKKLIEATLQKAVRKALLQHKRAGNPIVVGKGDQVEWLAPEDIKITEEQ